MGSMAQAISDVQQSSQRVKMKQFYGSLGEHGKLINLFLRAGNHSSRHL
jgi:hypothetical protein